MKIKELFNKFGSRKDGYQQTIECGSFTLDFYYDEEDVEKCKIDIRCGVMMEVTLNATHEAYGFLMSCLHDDDKEVMEAYCGMLWQSSHLLAVDSTFPRRVTQSWQKYYKEIEKRAEKMSKEVTPEQNEADEALMNEAVKIAEMSKEEQAKVREDVIAKLENLGDNKKKKKNSK